MPVSLSEGGDRCARPWQARLERSPRPLWRWSVAVRGDRRRLRAKFGIGLLQASPNAIRSAEGLSLRKDLTRVRSITLTKANCLMSPSDPSDDLGAPDLTRR